MSGLESLAPGSAEVAQILSRLALLDGAAPAALNVLRFRNGVELPMIDVADVALTAASQPEIPADVQPQPADDTVVASPVATARERVREVFGDAAA